MEISKQQIIDCSWGSGNHGCRGGFPAKALAWVARNGVATKKSYGPYLGEVSMGFLVLLTISTLSLIMISAGFSVGETH